MGYYAGLDVSLNRTAICLVDDDGTVVMEGWADTHPEMIFRAPTSVPPIVFPGASYTYKPICCPPPMFVNPAEPSEFVPMKLPLTTLSVKAADTGSLGVSDVRTKAEVVTGQVSFSPCRAPPIPRKEIRPQSVPKEALPIRFAASLQIPRGPSPDPLKLTTPKL